AQAHPRRGRAVGRRWPCRTALLRAARARSVTRQSPLHAPEDRRALLQLDRQAAPHRRRARRRRVLPRLKGHLMAPPSFRRRSLSSRLVSAASTPAAPRSLSRKDQPRAPGQVPVPDTKRHTEIYNYFTVAGATKLLHSAQG